MILKYSLGIDIDSKELEANLSTIDKEQKVKVISSRKFRNTLSGFKKLVVWIKRLHKEKEIPLVIVMEASGVYHENCSLHLYRAGYYVSIILANRANKYLEMRGYKSKTDKLDAKGLAQMAAEQCLRQWHPAPVFYQKLRSLTRHYQSLQEMKTMCTNRLHANKHSAYSSTWVKEQLEQEVKRYKKKLLLVRKQIKQHLATDKEVNRKIQNICRIKGVAFLTVSVIIAETFGFHLFENNRQLISYVGYDVVENQSGRRIGKTRISKKGNSHIRRGLHMPAFLVVTHGQKAFADLFERLFAKHGIKMKAYVAVQKKLLTTIFALWKNDTVYDNNYQQKVAETKVAKAA